MTKSIFQDFFAKLCVFSEIKDIKHIKQNFHSVAWVMHQGWNLGVLEGTKILVLGIIDWAFY